MSNTFFRFKQFIIHQDRCAMKVTTDSCLFGSFVANELKEQGALRILDIGTGTGLLTLMLAQKNPQARIDAIEIDDQVAEQAIGNIAPTPWVPNIKVIPIDIHNYPFPYRYDIIISNPPFYENELKGANQKKNRAQHSEQLTLTGLLSIIKNNLSLTGRFYLLLPYKRFDEVLHLLKTNNLSAQQITFVKQTPGHPYSRFIIEGIPESELKIIAGKNEIIIKDEHQQYTSAFVELLKDYYLNL